MRSKEPGIMRRGRTWYARVQRDGRDVWRAAGPTRQEALELRARMVQDAARKRIGLPVESTKTFADFVNRSYVPWAEARKRSVERDKYALKHLLPVFGGMRLADITRDRVEAYQEDRLATTIPGGRKITPRTVNVECSILRRILSRAVELGELDENPLARLPMLREAPARQPLLDPEQEAALLAACPGWLAELVRAAIITGARQGELLALTWRHVDLSEGVLTVPSSKTGESRRVPLPRAFVDDLRARRQAPEAVVFGDRHGRPLLRDHVTKAFARAARRAGLANLRFHDLRHVAASRWLASGAALPEVASILGHRTLSISRRYAHPKWDRLRDLVERAASPPLPPAPVPAATGEVLDFGRKGS